MCPRSFRDGPLGYGVGYGTGGGFLASPETRKATVCTRMQTVDQVAARVCERL